MSPPTLDPGDDLGAPLELNLDAVVDPIMASRTQSPIVVPTRASELSAHLPAQLPRRGSALRDALAEVRSLTDNYCRRITHPGFFGFVAPSGLPTDPVAHAMVAALNQNVIGYPASPAAATVERTVVNWLAGLVGYPEQSDGLLLSGGSIANMTAIGAALIDRFGATFHREGLIAAAGGTATHGHLLRGRALLDPARGRVAGNRRRPRGGGGDR